MTQACLNPFRWLDITAVNSEQIQFSQCIRSWGGDDCILSLVSVGEAANLSLETLWNDPRAIATREHTKRNWVAEWCKGCPRLASAAEPTIDSDSIDWATVPNHWTHINLAYDKSCNLCCLSCRADPICHGVGSEHYNALMELECNVIKPVLHRAEWAYLSGLGDPFGSPAYWHLLSTLQPDESPNLRWHIQTNGLGFTRRQYDQIPTRAQIASVQFSVDAATKETYERLRGGSWSRLLDNLQFVGNLRSSGTIDTLAISMVVQQDNWGQMHEFWQLGRDAGVDLVQFNCLLNQGTYDETDYSDRAVHLSRHPSHRAFVRACEDINKLTSPNVMIEVPRE